MRGVLKSALVLGAVMTAGLAIARDYTPQQLNRMIAAGRYPQQGPAQSQSKSMNFGDCKSRVRMIAGSVGGDYPVQTIADSGVMYSVKIWANDGVTLATCSALDRAMTLTMSRYR